MNESNIHLQARGKHYNLPHPPTPPTQDNFTSLNVPLKIPCIDPTPKLTCQPIHYMAHNLYMEATQNYSMVDDLS